MGTSRALRGSVLLFIILLASSPVSGQAQQQRPQVHSDLGALRTAAGSSAPGHRGEGPIREPAAPHYDVVAVRVEFQPDTGRFTTGNGTFAEEIFEGIDVLIDPLPHDDDHFRAHLSFLENYVERVSGGQTTVTTHLVPEIVTVSGRMGSYSPTGPDAGSDEELVKMARLVEEAWHEASQASSFDMSRFDPETTALILFHAGSGRNLELTGTSLDNTPEDLPSLVFGERALQRLLDDPSIRFNDFPVNHTIVLPQTQSRLGTDFIADERFVAEFSTNGLLAASFFSFLGVPDLFDTVSGNSGIGPFGLMDPFGIFAYNGLFPPEPEAWTKYYLGWLEPERVSGAGPETLALRANSAPGVNEAILVPISGTEYYLIENRNRDYDGDGLTIRVWQEGRIVEQHIAHGTSGFQRFDQSTFTGGVLIDVDNYDWALPGTVDELDRPQLGGILIWHIDERIIRSGLDNNRVNADPDRRGVGLIEADGAQDLGYPSDDPFGPQAHIGTPFDLFYQGNPVRVIAPGGQEIRLYENRFGPDTIPASLSNEGGATFVVLEDFSAPGYEMTFTYFRESSDEITPVPVFDDVNIESEVFSGGAVKYLTSDGLVRNVMIFTGSEDSSGSGDLVAVNNANGRIAGRWAGVYGPPAQTEELGTAFLRRDEVSDLLLTFWDGEEFTRFALPQETEALEPATPLVYQKGPGDEILHVGLIGDGTSYYAAIRENGGVHLHELEGIGEIAAMAAIGNGDFLIVGRDGATTLTGSDRWDFALDGDSRPGLAAGFDERGFAAVVSIPERRRFLVLREDGQVSMLDIESYLDGDISDAKLSEPVLADVQGDGLLEIVAAVGRRLFAFSVSGAVAEGFPVETDAVVTGQPLVVEYGSGIALLFGGDNGYIHAYSLDDARMQIDGFPLAVGSGVSGTPAVAGTFLTAVSDGGSVRQWEIHHAEDARWGQAYSDRANTRYVIIEGPADVPDPDIEGLLVASETYNWPNPVREGHTFIRFLPTVDSRVDVTIIDLAGTAVDELVLNQAQGGIASEIRWDVNVSSGVYFARVRVHGDDGREDTKIIRIAVIR